jgi:hypothetical protein
LQSKATLILSYISMVFNGLSGTLMNFVSPVISFYWYGGGWEGKEVAGRKDLRGFSESRKEVANNQHPKRFPVEQRALSTSIMSAAAPIGVAFGFLVGPSVVPRTVADPVSLEITAVPSFFLLPPSFPLPLALFSSFLFP